MPERRCLYVVLSFSIVAALLACESTGVQLSPGGTTSGGETIELELAPTPELTERIQASPDEFTWDHFRDNVVVTPDPESWSGDFQLCAARVIGTQLIGSACSRLLSVRSEDLTGGITSGQLLPEVEWFPGEVWFSLNHWEPRNLWVGSEFVVPTAEEAAAAAVSALDPENDQGVVVVFVAGSARVAGVKPFALVVGQR